MAIFLSLLVVVAVGFAAATILYPRRRQVAYMLGLVTELLPPSYAGYERWAVVTGASRGVGRGFVRALARDGWSLICLDLDDAELSAVVAFAVRQGSPNAVAVGVDVFADVSAAVAAITTAAAVHADGMLRLVVSNVGVSTNAPTLLEHHTADEVDKIATINSLFSFQLARAVWPLLRQGAEAATTNARTVAAATGANMHLQKCQNRKAGLIFVSSGSSLLPTPFVSVYGATKAGINHFASSLRVEATKQGEPLDILSVTPGYVASGNTPRWTGKCSGFSSPESIAEASLLLLACATNSVMSPLFQDVFGIELGTLLLPSCVLSSIVFERHAAQRKQILSKTGSVRDPSKNKTYISTRRQARYSSMEHA